MTNSMFPTNKSNPPKDPKGSARRKFRRRIKSVSHALEQLEIAIDDLFSQRGTVYKREEAERIKSAIDVFRDTTGIITQEPPPLTQEQMEHIENSILNGSGYSPPPMDQDQVDQILKELRESGDIPPLDDN